MKADTRVMAARSAPRSDPGEVADVTDTRTLADAGRVTTTEATTAVDAAQVAGGSERYVVLRGPCYVALAALMDLPGRGA